MRTLLSIAVLAAISSAALAAPPPPGVPEPETLSLLGIGLAGLIFAFRNKKK